MRVSFLGKGGSGKTTLSTSFIKFLESKDEKVLAIDADINVHLGQSLNMETKYLGDDFEEISKYLERNNKIIIGTTPPTKDSTFIKPSLDDEFFKKFATFKNKNLALLTVGTYTDKNVGYACYHSQLGSAVLIYNRLLDNDKLTVITDSTAGVDSVGTSMFCVSDINVFVVEPTKKSIDVYKDFVEITKKYKIKNKKSKELSDRINEIAEIFGYDEKFLMKSPFVLSGGEKKMLGLALAVCLEPEILVLDEPTGALDYNTTVKFMKIVEKMKKNGTTVILVTHDENIVKQYSDYILKLQFKG